MLAVTEDAVHAFEHVRRGTRDVTGHAGDELAVWSRQAVAASWRHAGTMYAVTLVTPGADRPIRCQVGCSASSERFLRLLA